MLDRLPNGGTELLRQLRGLQVTPIDEDGSLRLHVATDALAHIDQRVPVTAMFDDVDRIQISALIHIVDGKLWELEVYKADGTKIVKQPDAQNIYF